MNPDVADRMFGLRPGTVRGWIRGSVLPPDPDEHAVVCAYLTRPAISSDACSTRELGSRRNERVAAHRAAVRAALTSTTDPEVSCTTDGPPCPEPRTRAAGAASG